MVTISFHLHQQQHNNNDDDNNDDIELCLYTQTVPSDRTACWLRVTTAVLCLNTDFDSGGRSTTRLNVSRVSIVFKQASTTVRLTTLLAEYDTYCFVSAHRY